MNSRCFASLSKSNLVHNAKVIKSLAPKSKIVAILKANGYGHGIRSVSKYLDKEIDIFGVSSVAEGLIIKNLNPKKRVVLMQGILSQSDLKIAIDNELEVAIHTSQHLDWLEIISKSHKIHNQFWFKLNTGMNRLGFSYKPFNLSEILSYSSSHASSNIKASTSHLDIRKEKRFADQAQILIPILKCKNNNFACKETSCTCIANHQCEIAKLSTHGGSIENISSEVEQLNFKQHKDKQHEAGTFTTHSGSIHGGPIENISSEVEQLNSTKNNFYRLQGMTSKAPIIFSHFACADNISDPLNFIQIRNFEDFALRENENELSLCNSAGILNFPEYHFDYVRPGLMLYGISPISNISAQQLDLKPVLQLESVLIAKQKISPGESVGYSRRFVAEKNMTIGIVGFGYGDGYKFVINKGFVNIKGNLCRIIGSISMDLTIVDISDINCEIGDPVILIGEGINANNCADYFGTHSWDIIANIQNRVKFEWV